MAALCWVWGKKSPPLVIIDDEAEYEIERILSSRKVGRGIQYLVRWKGDPTGIEDQWIPRPMLFKPVTRCTESKISLTTSLRYKDVGP